LLCVSKEGKNPLGCPIAKWVSELHFCHLYVIFFLVLSLLHAAEIKFSFEGLVFETFIFHYTILLNTSIGPTYGRGHVT